MGARSGRTIGGLPADTSQPQSDEVVTSQSAEEPDDRGGFDEGEGIDAGPLVNTGTGGWQVRIVDMQPGPQ